MTRKSLSDILHGAERSGIETAWADTEAAEDFGPLPTGEYVARIESGELTTGKTKGTPGYKLTFRVLEGDHAGHPFWHDLWLTPAALPWAKRDLGKLGIDRLEQLERPLPPGIRCRVKLALRKDDDGTEYNRVRSFEVIGIDAPEVDPFAPQTAEEGGSDDVPPATATAAPDEGGDRDGDSADASPPEDADQGEGGGR